VLEIVKDIFEKLRPRLTDKRPDLQVGKEFHSFIQGFVIYLSEVACCCAILKTNVLHISASFFKNITFFFDVINPRKIKVENCA